MAKLTINGKDVEAAAGTNLVEAAKQVGVEIPVFCYHPKLSIAAQCRMCLVEVEKMPKLVPACQTPVAEGMVVKTDSERVKTAQAGVMEFLLLNHPVDCPICDQAGECALQDYYMVYDLTGSRSTVGKVHKPKVQDIGGGVVLDSERCVMCSRCVRYFDEITGDAQMGFFNRGDRVEVSIFPDSPLHGEYCGNVVDLCPVGALTWKDFRFKCRVWFLEKAASVCPGCARGCNVTVEHNEGKVFRLKPRDNEAVNQCWMCDEGRASYKFVNEGRLLDPVVREEKKGVTTETLSSQRSEERKAYVKKEEAKAGSREPHTRKAVVVTWERALAVAAEQLVKVVATKGGAAIGVVLSPQATLEDNRAVVRFAADHLGVTAFYMGGRLDGEGDAFLRLADKNPNRAGVLAALEMGAVARGLAARTADDVVADVESGKLSALIVMGNNLPVSPDARARLVSAAARLDAVIVMASNRSELVDAATVALPSATFAEKEGTFVNAMGMHQKLRRGIALVGRALPETQIVQKLAAKMGFDFRPAREASAASPATAAPGAH
ncbi:MAG: (2Fe-2S)-binding protein [Deltaproteobacteria bacterium]|nr:(2Fe-2S)-binding protein [Deltaproteobacteria bacterium]